MVVRVGGLMPRIGDKRTHSEGYVLVYRPDHPKARKNTFTIFGAPVAKQRPRTVTNPNGDAVTYTPRKTRDYENDIAWEAKAQHIRRQSGLVAVRFRLYGGRGDVDNIVKSCLDGMNGVVYDDDRQVEEMHVYMDRDAQVPRAEITIGAKGELFEDEVAAAAAAMVAYVKGPLRHVDARELAVAALSAARSVTEAA